MSESPTAPEGEPADATASAVEPPAIADPPPDHPAPGAYPPPPAGYETAYPPAEAGPLGEIRSTGICILLTIVTLGIYPLYWYYAVHNEMQRHRNGQGLGGVLALVLAFFVGIVMPYISSDEIGKMYEARGQAKPVSAMTGLWYFPGIFLFFIGPFVWFIKTNGALNRYWESLGATG